MEDFGMETSVSLSDPSLSVFVLASFLRFLEFCKSSPNHVHFPSRCLWFLQFNHHLVRDPFFKWPENFIAIFNQLFSKTEESNDTDKESEEEENSNQGEKIGHHRNFCDNMNIFPVKNVTWILMEIPSHFTNRWEIYTKFMEFGAMSFVQVLFVFHAKT